MKTGKVRERRGGSEENRMQGGEKMEEEDIKKGNGREEKHIRGREK